MRLLKRVLVMVSIVGLVAAFAGCHGSPERAQTRTQKLQWHSSADAENVLEFNLEGHTVLGRIHMVLFQSRVKGTYILKKGGVTTEGQVIQDSKGYTLVSEDGTKQRLLYGETPNSLKDEDGTVWKNSDSAIALREW